MARSPPSCRRPYRSSRWHPRTYILAYFIHKKHSLNHFFGALYDGPRGSTPTFSNPSPNDTHRRIFPRLSTAILTKDFLRHSQPSTSTLHQHHVCIPLVALPTLGFFPPLYLHLKILTNVFTQALPTSNVTPTPTRRSDSSPRLTYDRMFFRLFSSILTFS